MTVNQYYSFILALISGMVFLNLYKTNSMALSQAELVAKVDVLTTQVTKVQGEIAAVKQALADALANGQAVSPELEAAVNNLGTAIQAADDLNPDA